MISSTLERRPCVATHHRPDLDPVVADAERPDVRLRRRIEHELRSCGHPPLGNVSLHVDDGHVRLAGAVPSYYLKQLAQEAVRRVDGVHRIDNGLAVHCQCSDRPPV